MRKEYSGIPGRTVFDGEQSRRGYHLKLIDTNANLQIVIPSAGCRADRTRTRKQCHGAACSSRNDLANPVQRPWRDVNAVGRHISMNWDAVGRMYGQIALRLEPSGQY